MNVSKEGVAITDRFFEALDMLKAKKKIRGLQTFTREFDINRWNMLTVRNNRGNAVLKVEWIYYLCSKYGVSVEWLVLNKGGMFDKSEQPKRIAIEMPASERFPETKYLGKKCSVQYKTATQKRNVEGMLTEVKYDMARSCNCWSFLKPNGRKAQIDEEAILSITNV